MSMPMDIDIDSIRRIVPAVRQAMEQMQSGRKGFDPHQPGGSYGKGEGSGASSMRQARSGKVLKESSKRKKKKKKASLRVRVKNLEKDLAQEKAVSKSYTRKILNQNGIIAGIQNGVSYHNFDIGTMSHYETAIGIGVALTDGAAESTLSFTGVTSSDGIPAKISRRVTFRNNKCTPVKAVFYELSYKIDGSISPGTAISNGLVDKGLTITDGTDLFGYWPTDSLLFKKNFNIEQKESVYMNPGDEFRMGVHTGWHNYFGEYDTLTGLGTNSSKNHYNTRTILVRLQGVLCHQSGTPFTVGLTVPSLDYLDEVTWEVKIPDEGNLSNYITDKQLGAPVNETFCGPNNPEQTA